MTKLKSISLTLILLVVSCAMTGCGGPTGPDLNAVSGKITKNGKPFVGASIEFYPVGEGAASYGFSDADGNFTLRYSTGKPGAVPGEHKVNVIGGSATGGMPEAPTGEGDLAPMSNPSGGRSNSGPKAVKGIPVTVSSDPQNNVKIEL